MDKTLKVQKLEKEWVEKDIVIERIMKENRNAEELDKRLINHGLKH